MKYKVRDDVSIENEILLKELKQILKDSKNPIDKKMSLNLFMEELKQEGHYFLSNERNFYEFIEEIEKEVELKRLIKESYLCYKAKKPQKAEKKLKRLTEIYKQKDVINTEFLKILDFNHTDFLKHTNQLNEKHKTYGTGFFFPIIEDFYEGTKRKKNKIYNDSHADSEIHINNATLSLFAAPTSHGKTTFLNNLAVNLIKKNQIEGSIIFLSYEESQHSLYFNALTCFVNKTYIRDCFYEEEFKNYEMDLKYFINFFSLYQENIHKLDVDTIDYFVSKKYPKRVVEIIINFFKLMSENKIRFLNASDIFNDNHNVSMLLSFLEKLIKEYNAEFFLIDYVQLLKKDSGNRNLSRAEVLKDICLDLKNFAHKHSVPICLAAQFNRQVDSVEKLSSFALGESGDLERSASLILGLWNHNFDDDSQEEIVKSITIKVLKNRQGFFVNKKRRFHFDPSKKIIE